jgi:HEAT repeat protein
MLGIVLISGCATETSKDQIQAYYLTGELKRLEPNESAVRLNDELIAMGETAVPAVIELFESHAPRDRGNAAWILAEIRDRRAISVLTRKGLHDPDAFVRELSAQALGSIGDPSAIPYLQKLASEDTDTRVTDAAVGAIENIRSQMRSLR